MNLLIVEDDPQLADVIRRGPARDEHSAAVCGNGDDAFLHLRFGEFDGVVLDIMLPGMNGIDLCRRIVDAHGGPVTVRSHPGSGTTFAILLPSHPPPIQSEALEAAYGGH